MLLVSAAMHGADSWALEVLDGSSRRLLEVTAAEIGTAVVIDPDSGDRRRLTVLDLAGMPETEPSSAVESVELDPEVAASAHSSATAPPASGSDRSGSSARKTLTALLGFAMFLIVATGGFAAGWFTHRAQDDDSNASALDSMVPLADLFDSSPGALDGREVPGRAGRWSDPSDSFVVADGGVQASPDGDSPVIAIVEQSGSITSVRASYSTVATGAGLVFRYQDEANHWKVTAAPDFGTWAISRIEDGTVKTIGDSGFSSGSTVEVIFVGSTIQFWVEGVLRETIRDEFLAESNLVGLVVGPDGQDAVCDEFVANTM